MLFEPVVYVYPDVIKLVRQEECTWKDFDVIHCSFSCKLKECKSIQYFQNMGSEHKDSYILIKSMLKDRNIALLNLHNTNVDIRTIANCIMSGTRVIDKT